MKKPFIVAYDYGQGSGWARIQADSPEAITARYPELTVYADVPSGLDEKSAAIIRARPLIDIDDPPAGWLVSLIESRTRPRSGSGS